MSYTAYRDNCPQTSRDNCRLPQKSALGYFCLDMKTFQQALMEAVERNGVSLRSVAEATGVSYEQLKKLKQNKSKSTNVDDAIKIAAYFGQSVDDFIDHPGLKADLDLSAVLSQLTQEERRFLLNAAKAQIAARD